MTFKFSNTDIEQIINFDSSRQIAIIWDIDDVKSLDLELNDKECLEVLMRAKDKHDANQGINWDVLEHFAQLVRIESMEKGA
jgi:hypothetical protein